MEERLAKKGSMALSCKTPRGFFPSVSPEKLAAPQFMHLAAQTTQTTATSTVVGVGSSFLKMFVGNDGEFMFLPRGYTIEAEHVDKHWITITAPSGLVYQVWLESYLDSFVFRSGWADVMARERIEQGDIGLFTRTGAMSFCLVVMTRGGMQKAPATKSDHPQSTIRPSKATRWQDVKFFRNKGVKRCQKLVSTLYSLWVASKHPFVLYATTIKQSAINNGTMLLSLDVSSKLPAGPVRCGLVFDGSPLMFASTILKRGDGSVKITDGWIHFVRAHNISTGVVYVFKFEICDGGWQATCFQV